jgi:ABC-type nitrate/sulfonate/bicarbonate transport system substrate-binding protein
MPRISVGIDAATLIRRQLLRGAVAASAAAVLPGDLALAQTKLNFGYMKIGDLSPFFMATEKGFFKEAGLDITLASMVGGAAIQPALASGAINIGWTNVVSMCQGYL